MADAGQLLRRCASELEDATSELKRGDTAGAGRDLDGAASALRALAAVIANR